MGSPSDIAIAEYVLTASMGCKFELLVKMLAQNLHLDFTKDLTKILDDIINAIELDKSKKEILLHCSYLRNKIFHIELSKASGKLVSLNTEFERGTVFVTNLDFNETRAVKDTSTNDGTIFGWLFENMTGANLKLCEKFNEAFEIIDELMKQI